MPEEELLSELGVDEIITNNILGNAVIVMIEGAYAIGNFGTETYRWQELGYNNEYVEARFGGMLNAFKFGAPPHAGCAPGLDRIFMVLEGVENIRDIVAFPKNGSGVDLMMNSPSPVDQIQLDEAHLAIIPEED